MFRACKKGGPSSLATAFMKRARERCVRGRIEWFEQQRAARPPNVFSRPRYLRSTTLETSTRSKLRSLSMEVDRAAASA